MDDDLFLAMHFSAIWKGAFSFPHTTQYFNMEEEKDEIINLEV
ncbi:hypothetical protein LYSBPC_23930 [Lysinibacillus piscis]|uniref:Uncharacterized protein n=1 Tax=Lysinibacillus piscis TaxID=2518931 RepID=A0ABQ5NLN5_9BACI|nr:hypothetical protein LYSBPC_23930 [Lysinibacillus sp. KH24]